MTTSPDLSGPQLAFQTAVLTYLTPSYGPLNAVTSVTRREYCDKWGYHYVEQREPNNRLFHPWKKFAMLQQMLQTYKTVMVMDPDTMVMNHNIEISRYEFAVCSDRYGINVGTMIFGQSPTTFKFLDAILVHQVGYLGHYFKEQQCILDLISKAGLYRDWAIVLPQRNMNSYLNEEYGRDPQDLEETFVPGNWIVQFPALRMSRRLYLANKMLKEVQK